MTEQEYKQKRCECFVKFCKDNGIDQKVNISIFDAFDQIFDRAYALGKQEEDAEGEEMLTCVKDQAVKLYNIANKAYAINGDKYYQGYMNAMIDLFGSKCLPDGLNADNFAKSEPKFHKGDKVEVINYDFGLPSLSRCVHEVFTVSDVKYNANQWMYKLETNKWLFNERGYLESIQWCEHFLKAYKEPNPAEEVDVFNDPEPKCLYFKDGKCAHPAVAHLENGKLVKGADCDVSSCEDVEYEPKPAEPKFHKGDKVEVINYDFGLPSLSRCVHEVFTVSDAKYNANQWMYKLETNKWLFNERDYLESIQWCEHFLKAYKEPQPAKPKNEGTRQEQCVPKNAESGTHSFDNIIKDGFRGHNRLHIAAMAMQGILSNADRMKKYQYVATKPPRAELEVVVARKALRYADTLIAECEKTDKNNKI